MKLSHLVGLTVGVVIVLIIRLQYQFPPAVFLYGFGVIFVASLGARYWLHRDSSDVSPRVRSSAAVSPSDAPGRVNTYLRETPGRWPIDYTNRRKLHDDTRWIKLDGDKKLAYAVIGREQDQEDEYEVDTIRVIWNLTDDEFVAYDGWVPGEHRTNPWFNKEKWQHREGYRANQYQNAGQSGPNVFVTTDGGRSAERETDEQ